MNKKEYLREFSRAVHWRLPPKEAAEVLSDYKDILDQRPASDSGSLVQDFGDPRVAARLLCEPRKYFLWMVVFCILVVSILLPEVMLLRAQFHRNVETLVFGILVFGISVSFLWFRPRRGETRPPIPKGLPLRLILLLLCLLLAAGLIWGLAYGVWEFLPTGCYGLAARWVLWVTGAVSTAAGVWALVRARVANSSWCAMYVLALTVVMVCILVMALLTSLELDRAAADWYMPYLIRCGVAAGLGLIGTVMSLC